MSLRFEIVLTVEVDESANFLEVTDDSELEVIKEKVSDCLYDLDDVETILGDMESTTFEVDDKQIAENTDETEVSVAVGRYKFKVPADDFYDWEEMVQSSTNSKDVVDISLWIKESLGLN